jgi:hypothetical protein
MKFVKKLVVAVVVTLTVVGTGSVLAFAAQGPDSATQTQAVQSGGGADTQGTANQAGVTDSQAGVQEQGEVEQGEADEADASDQQGPQDGPEDQQGPQDGPQDQQGPQSGGGAAAQQGGGRTFASTQ